MKKHRHKAHGEPKAVLVREPPAYKYSVVESDIFDNEEYYIFTHKEGHQLARRKVGSWTNISQIAKMIRDIPEEDLEAEIEAIVPRHKCLIHWLKPRYKGVWVPLYKAEIFARRHGIYQQVAPLLNFKRVAKVEYCGLAFYEYFASPNVDEAVRILRDSKSNTVNMDQIFTLYQKLRDSRGSIVLKRSFYRYFKQILIRNDSTLCGGHWVPIDAAVQFCKKHGIYQHVRPILGFRKSPSELAPYPLDTVQEKLISHWKASDCSHQFYGFPLSFKGGLAPKKPKRNVFRLDEVTVAFDARVKISYNESSDKDPVIKNFKILRRLSDGGINASLLIEACCSLRITELLLDKDDPDLLITNTLYYRDRLEEIECESVTSSVSKYLSGKWCSIKDARALFSSFKIAGKSETADALQAFVYDKSNYPLESDDEVNSDDSGNGLEIIPEDDFKHTSKPKTDIFLDKLCSENESTSEEEVFEITGFDNDNEIGEVEALNVENDVDKRSNTLFVDSSEEESDYDILGAKSIGRYENTRHKEILVASAGNQYQSPAKLSPSSPQKRSSQNNRDSSLKPSPETRYAPILSFRLHKTGDANRTCFDTCTMDHKTHLDENGIKKHYNGLAKRVTSNFRYKPQAQHHQTLVPNKLPPLIPCRDHRLSSVVSDYDDQEDVAYEMPSLLNPIRQDFSSKHTSSSKRDLKAFPLLCADLDSVAAPQTTPATPPGTSPPASSKYSHFTFAKNLHFSADDDHFSLKIRTKPTRLPLQTFSRVKSGETFTSSSKREMEHQLSGDYERHMYEPSRKRPSYGLNSSRFEAKRGKYSDYGHGYISSYIHETPSSPPNNYCHTFHEPFDVKDFVDEDLYGESTTQTASTRGPREFDARDKLMPFKRLLHWQTGSKQELFKRSQVIFDDKSPVGFAERMYAMIDEYKRHIHEK